MKIIFSLRTLFILFAVTFIFSCGNSKQNELDRIIQKKLDSALSDHGEAERLPAETKKMDFIFIPDKINISNINKFIHPEKGLWVVNSSGAMPNMTNTSQVDKNFPVDFSNCKLEELPKINCELKNFWTKEGCYFQKINSFKDEKIWTYASLKKEDEAKVEATAKKIQYTVINTANNARYYFALLADGWNLVIVDLRKPCEA